MARMDRMMRNMRPKDKKRLAKGMARRRNPMRTLVIIFLILLILFFLAPYFWP